MCTFGMGLQTNVSVELLNLSTFRNCVVNTFNGLVHIAERPFAHFLV